MVNITGNVKVGKGAGFWAWAHTRPLARWDLTRSAGTSTPDQPLTLYLGSVTVDGNVTSNGGGLLSTSWADFRNFPVKDNVIHGNLIIQGWQGGWIGVIRNHVDGNVIVSKNVSLLTETGPGTDEDSTEVQTNAISGNLICHGYSLAAHVNSNFPDLGQPNVVGGNAIGECAGLTQ